VSFISVSLGSAATLAQRRTQKKTAGIGPVCLLSRIDRTDQSLDLPLSIDQRDMPVSPLSLLLSRIRVPVGGAGEVADVLGRGGDGARRRR